MTDNTIWDKEIPIPAEVISCVDPAILKAKIEAAGPNGDEKNYFMKVHQGDTGKDMVSAFFQGMSSLHDAAPDLVARPISWGSYTSIAGTHFILCEFHNLSGAIPEKEIFTVRVAEMHKTTRLKSETFGFPYSAYGGNQKQDFPVTKTWEECFSKGLQDLFERETETNGHEEENERFKKAMIEKVIPRLLRPLETGDRKIIPVLVHGDLWDGNASVHEETGRPVIFDATPVWAHNEYELGPWFCPRHKFNEYISDYTNHFPISDPKEEFEDRGALYSLRFDMLSSSLYPGNLKFRYLAMETMRKLVKRYGDGDE
ncbi:hypothetical protein HYALB_00010924 [Hymenoscyphus albidus]|uniref:protein-ribulosamine 3-kinase n=1 Tax=Hymenoscyphus albidus TaxID=595503 RepID=A0A9N9Q2T0_9HELO|nr:hypothetical protein HYALB_00010924 [Hymenoscyphus albidus]